MLNDAKCFDRIYIACGYTDLRRGIDGLASIVQNEFHMDPFTPRTLFMFCGRRTDRIKCLVWEEDGFLLLYKRLEGKAGFQWPRTAEEVQSITYEQFQWGHIVQHAKSHRKIQAEKTISSRS